MLLSLKVSLHFSTMGLVTILCVLSEVDADTRHAPKSAPKSFKKTVEDASLLVYFQIDFLSLFFFFDFLLMGFTMEIYLNSWFHL